MSKILIISCFVIAFVTLFSVVEALRFMPEKKSIASIKKDPKYVARRQINERLHAAHTNGLMEHHIGKFKGGNDCGTCEFAVGAILDVLTNPTLENITIDTIDETVCAKKFNTTKDIELCDKIAKLLIDVLGDLGRKAENGGWNLAADICGDFLGKCSWPCCVTPFDPEQILLSYANNGQVVSDSMAMRVTWSTLNFTTGDFISFKEAGTSSWTTITEVTQQAQGNYSWNYFGQFHSGVMPNLKPGTTYEYYVGSQTGNFSFTYSFTTLPSNIGTSARPFRAAAVADIGNKNSENTIAGILALAQSGQIDMLLIIGDISYWDGDMQRWAIFGRLLQPISSIIPVHTCPGNHDTLATALFSRTADPWSQYRMRFVRPSGNDGAPAGALYYQLNVGPVNMFFLNSETWIDTPDLDATQMNWVQPLLAKANQNSGQMSVVMHHRPLYCSNGGSPCYGGSDSNLLRMQAEQIYNDNKVDFVFSGHVHSFESMTSVKNGISQGTSMDFPTAPVYLVGGNAGQPESLAQFHDAAYPWDRVRASVIGYQIFEFAQGVSPLDSKIHTSLNMTAIQSSNGAILDNYLLTSSR